MSSCEGSCPAALIRSSLYQRARASVSNGSAYVLPLYWVSAQAKATCWSASAAADVLGLVVVLVHAPSTRVIAAPSANHRNRPERGLMAPPTRLLRTVAE